MAQTILEIWKDQSTKQSSFGMTSGHLLICSGPQGEAPAGPLTVWLFLPGLIVNASSSGQGPSAVHSRPQPSPQSRMLCSGTPAARPTCLISYEQQSQPYVKLQENRCCFSICEIKLLEWSQVYGHRHQKGKYWSDSVVYAEHLDLWRAHWVWKQEGPSMIRGMKHHFDLALLAIC